MNAFLTIEALGKRYGSVTALANVNVTVERGAVFAVLGPNGAGKSTLFGALLGLIRPTTGQILREGRPIAAELRRATGYMPERISLYPQCSVLENGTFFARLKGVSTTEFERQLKRVGLYHAQDRPAGKLSKGMLQRLGLAIALCGEPQLLILDEPFNGLDPALLEALQIILAEERTRGATLLISTHTIAALEPLATHLAVLLDGRIAAQGPVDHLRSELGAISLESLYYAVARRRTIEEVAA